MAKIIEVIALLVILLLGNKFRTYSYASVPHPGETTDEYGFAWAGLSLLKGGLPESWTSVKNAYPEIKYEKINVDTIYDKDPTRPPFSMVSPWFDKPPTFALIIGGYSYLKGAKEFIEAGTAIIRRPMLKIALITTILIYLLARRLFGIKVGLLAALLYSVIPTTVFSSRLALSENGYIPLFLAALLFIERYLTRKKNVYLILASLMAAIGITFKLSAIAILISLLLILVFYLPPKGRKRILITAFLVGISGLVAFCLYGAFFGWHTFIRVFLAQSQFIYGASSEILFSAITQSKITATKFFTDGWITAGWISFLLLSFTQFKKDRGVTFITLSVFAYLIVFLIFGSEGYGWYRFPFLPFLVISLAKLFIDLFKAPNLPVFIILSFLPFGTTLHRLIGVEGFQLFVPSLRLFLYLVLAIFFYELWKKKSKEVFSRTLILIVFLFLIYLSIKLIYFYNYGNWFFVT